MLTLQMKGFEMIEITVKVSNEEQTYRQKFLCYLDKSNPSTSIMLTKDDPELTAMVWFFLKVTAASVMAAGVCFKFAQVLQARIGWQTPLRALAVLVMVSAVGFVMTGVLAKLFRVRELDSYLAKLRF